MNKTIKYIYKLLFYFILLINTANALPIINTYAVTNQPCNHTIVDSLMSNLTQYIGNTENNKFKINQLLDEKSYRLNKQIIALLAFKNTTNTQQHLNFYASRFRFIETGFFTLNDDNTININTSNEIISDKQFLEIKIKPNSVLNVFLIMKPVSFKDYYSNKNLIYKYNDIHDLPKLDNRSEIEKIGFCVLMLLMLGIILILFVFYGLAYLNLKDNVYATYTIYLFITFCQVLYMAQYTFAKNFVLFNYVGNSLLDEGTKGIMVIFYCIFLIQSLDLLKKNVVAYYSFLLLIIISLAYVLSMAIAYIFTLGFYFEPVYFLAYRIPLFVLSLTATIAALFIKNKTNFQKLILIGSWLYIIFAIFSFLQDINFPFENMWVSIHGLYFGVALELILFSIALATRVRDTYKESERLKDIYIKELKQNEEFIKNENIILESRVKERVKVIEQQNILIEEQKRNALIQTYEKEKLEIQQLALSSQMNPHFIFNCMNSIQHLIVTGNTEKASIVLHDFASLIRMVLENSAQPDITLENEIILLNTYLKLEQERTNNGFDYEITIDENIIPDFVKIPTMMLQPFLENILVHGFKFISYKGKINIHFSVTKNLICCKIIDNGIGRKKAIENKLRYQSSEKKSIAINIIQNRIALLNQTYKEQTASLIIEDLIDDNNIPTGTKVNIFLPII